MTENEIGAVIVDTAIAIHRDLGPGLLESVYEIVMAQELDERGLDTKRQVSMAIVYKGSRIENAFFADLVVGGKVIVELKSVENLTRAHRKQVQTYLRLTGMKLGFLLNFGEALMKDGIVRAVNNLEEAQRPSSFQRSIGMGPLQSDSDRGEQR